MAGWALPGLRRFHERPGHGRQVSAGLEKRGLETLDELRGWIVRHEVPRELLSDVACRGAVRRQIAKHVHAGDLPAVRIVLAQHCPVSGFVARRGKEELAGFRCGIGKIADRPAGQNACQAGDIVLRIAAADAQRVQLQDFAREIFVQSPPAVEAGLAVGADRLRVVEIDQHGRMLLDGDQHVGETAQHVRADRLALVGTGHAAHGALVGRDAKVIGPEHHEPFEEGSVRGRGMVEARESLLLKCLPPDASGLLGRWRRRLRLRHVGGCFGYLAGFALELRLWFLRRLRIGGLGRSHHLGALGLFLLALRRERRGKGHVTGFKCSIADRRGVGAGQRLQHKSARIAGNAL